MKPLRSTLPSVLACLLLLCAACGGDDPTSPSLEDVPDELVVTWFGTSLIVNGSDLMNDGTRLRLTFAANGTYEILATRDLVGVFCDAEYDCSNESGTFTATQTELVFDPGTEDAFSMSMTVTPTTLRLTGSDEGTTLDLSFVLPPLPDLIGTWIALNLRGTDGRSLSGGGSPTTLAITFEADGSFAVGSAFSPPDQFCEFSVSCLDGGTYTVDADLGEIIFGPLEPDPITMQVSVEPNSLRLNSQDAVGTAVWGFLGHYDTTPGESGTWFAISLLVDGVDQTDPANGGTVQCLTLNGSTYSIESEQSPEGFRCGQAADPNFTSSGSYAASLDRFDFTDDLDPTQTLNSLSMETTPISLRLFGVLSGFAVDNLYIRLSGN